MWIFIVMLFLILVWFEIRRYYHNISEKLIHNLSENITFKKLYPQGIFVSQYNVLEIEEDIRKHSNMRAEDINHTGLCTNDIEFMIDYVRYIMVRMYENKGTL